MRDEWTRTRMVARDYRNTYHTTHHTRFFDNIELEHLEHFSYRRGVLSCLPAFAGLFSAVRTHLPRRSTARTLAAPVPPYTPPFPLAIYYAHRGAGVSFCILYIFK